jgi:hypothetical protein
VRRTVAHRAHTARTKLYRTRRTEHNPLKPSGDD